MQCQLLPVNRPLPSRGELVVQSLVFHVFVVAVLHAQEQLLSVICAAVDVCSILTKPGVDGTARYDQKTIMKNSKIEFKVNVTQRRYATCSAIAATALPALAMAKGHQISRVPEMPLVVDDSVQCEYCFKYYPD